MSSLLAAPEPSPDGTKALASLADDPAWTAARDQLSSAINSTTLWTYGGSARLRAAAREEIR
jgi:hypothetical protein